MNWIDNFLGWEIVPHKWDKYVYAFAGALVGGVVFGLTGSWLRAIQWDIFTVFVAWAVVKIAAPLGGWIASGFGLFKS
jgi:hypothetical protein